LKHTESTFKGHDGLDLFRQSWLPDEAPRAVLVLVHGLAEHGSRYGNIVRHFVPRGYLVTVLDLRGHGRSPGTRGYVARFRHYVEDIVAFLEQARADHPERPVFLVGHSMGGTIAAACAVEAQDALAGLILSGAVLKPGSSVSPLKLLIARMMSRLAPRLGVTTLDSGGISRDPAVVQAYEDDPLVHHGRISARLGGEFLSAIQSLPEMMPGIRLPILIMHGTDDRLSDPEGSRLLSREISSADKTLILYEGFYHEIFNEHGRERIFADMESWLADHLS
jgi:alpha-beta hydrolase superfamily lysophospholipase